MPKREKRRRKNRVCGPIKKDNESNYAASLASEDIFYVIKGIQSLLIAKINANITERIKYLIVNNGYKHPYFEVHGYKKDKHSIEDFIFSRRAKVKYVNKPRVIYFTGKDTLKDF